MVVGTLTEPSQQRTNCHARHLYLSSVAVVVQVKPLEETSPSSPFEQNEPPFFSPTAVGAIATVVVVTAAIVLGVVAVSGTDTATEAVGAGCWGVSSLTSHPAANSRASGNSTQVFLIYRTPF
jgi:negative regulator of sigma E activity